MDSGGVVSLANTNYETTVTAFIGYGDGTHNAAYNPAAVDDAPGTTEFFTRNMRNQAQTHQVEIFGTNNFSFSLGFRADASDWDGDGMPNVYEDENGFDSGNANDGSGDDDLDGVSNAGEFIGDTDPSLPSGGTDFPRVSMVQSDGSPGVEVQFPTSADRVYYIYYSNSDLMGPAWVLATSNGLAGTGNIVTWVDDGTLTDPHPAALSNRSYRVDTALPK